MEFADEDKAADSTKVVSKLDKWEILVAPAQIAVICPDTHRELLHRN